MRDVDQGVGGVAVVGDEAHRYAEPASLTCSFVSQLTGDRLSGLLDTGVVVGHPESRRGLDHGYDVYRDECAARAHCFPGRPGKCVPTGRRPVQSDHDHWYRGTNLARGILRPLCGGVLANVITSQQPMVSLPGRPAFRWQVR